MTLNYALSAARSRFEIETKGLGLAEAARVIAGALGGEARGTHATDPETGKVWKAVLDGSLHGVSAEIVTPILTYDEIPKLQEVARALRLAGARVDNECGRLEGRPETKEVIPTKVLKDSVTKAAYAYTGKHIGPKERVGNKGGSLSTPNFWLLIPCVSSIRASSTSIVAHRYLAGMETARGL